MPGLKRTGKRGQTGVTVNSLVFVVGGESQSLWALARKTVSTGYSPEKAGGLGRGLTRVGPGQKTPRKNAHPTGSVKDEKHAGHAVNVREEVGLTGQLYRSLTRIVK